MEVNIPTPFMTPGKERLLPTRKESLRVIHPYGSKLFWRSRRWITDLPLQGVVVFAQDRDKRHVALKIIKKESDHYNIINMLFKEQSKYPGKRIRGMLPILDILPFGGHWLLVMPRCDQKASN